MFNNKKGFSPVVILILIVMIVLAFIGGSGLLSIVNTSDDLIKFFSSPGKSSVSFDDYRFDVNVINGYNVPVWYDCKCYNDEWNWQPDSGTDGRCTYCKVREGGRCIVGGVEQTTCRNGGFQVRGCFYTAELYKDGVLIDEKKENKTRINPQGVFRGGSQFLLDETGLVTESNKYRLSFGSSIKNADGSCDQMSGSFVFLPDEFISSEVVIDKTEIQENEVIKAVVKVDNRFRVVSGSPCLKYELNTAFGSIDKIDCKNKQDFEKGISNIEFILNTSQVGSFDLIGVVQDLGMVTDGFSGFVLRDKSSLPPDFIVGDLESEKVGIEVVEPKEVETIFVEVVSEDEDDDSQTLGIMDDITAEDEDGFGFFQRIIAWFKNLTFTA